MIDDTSYEELGYIKRWIKKCKEGWNKLDEMDNPIDAPWWYHLLYPITAVGMFIFMIWIMSMFGE